MGAVKEYFINNIPNRQDFDSYGQTRTIIQKTGAVVTSKHTQAAPWPCAENAHVSKILGRAKESYLC